MLDMYYLLNIYDVKDLAYTYTRAYLGTVRSTQRPRKDFGAFEESRLIRTEDNSIFTLLTCPEIYSRADANHRQAIGSNVQEYFVHVIAHFILNGYPSLPSNKIKIGFAINHSNAHWTMMLAEYNGIDVGAYEKLFEKYQNAVRAKRGQRDPSTDEKTHQMNLIRRFILSKQGVRLHSRLKRGTLTSNGRLPLKVDSIHLKHYDSLGSDSSELLRDASQFVSQSNPVRISHEKCPHQTGMTCGDWSVFNAFANGVLKKKTRPTSRNLRELKNNLTVPNADQILRKAELKVEPCSEAERICVTRKQRKIMEEEFNGRNQGVVQNVVTFAYSALRSAKSALNYINPFSNQAEPPKRRSRGRIAR